MELDGGPIPPHGRTDLGPKFRSESQQRDGDHLRRNVARWKSLPRVRPGAFGVSWPVAPSSSKEGFPVPSGGRGDGPDGGGGQGMEPPVGRSGDEPEPRGRQRYLKCESPEDVPIGKPFSVLVSVVLGGVGGTALKLFDVPQSGTDVLLVAHAPGLRVLGGQRRVIHVPSESNSEPVMFELQAEASGRRRISITAWNGGTYLGELAVEVTAEHDSRAGRHRDTLTEIETDPVEGAVSLVVRYDPRSNSYRFEFRDEDNPCEVTGSLAYEPGAQVEKLICNLDDLAKGRSGYSPGQVRDYLINAGADLWQQMVPPALREQFWERQHRIRQLTILADKDAIPWELLYPRDLGHDAGFLVDQFPVTRAIFGRKPARQIGLRPARFVLPDDSLPEARAEVDVMRRLLEAGSEGGEIVSALTPLQELIRCADFGLLHFACHNQFNVADGSSIVLGNAKFTPTLLTTAVIDKVLEVSAPTIFMNACRSAGLSATYNRLDGWASKFLEAGAGAFIGSLWAVSDGAAREFAQEFYTQLRAGYLLGDAVGLARKKAADQQDDPTWLAYTVYGDPRAAVDGNFKY